MVENNFTFKYKKKIQLNSQDKNFHYISNDNYIHKQINYNH